MGKLIDKDPLVAEIEKRVAALKVVCDRSRRPQFTLIGKIGGLELCLSLIDTLEVKEADLDFQHFAKEMAEVFALPSSITKNTEEEPLNWEYAIAKHFFELGLKARQG